MNHSFRHEEIFDNHSLFLTVQIWVWGVKDFCLQFLVNNLPLGSVEIRIFLQAKIWRIRRIRILSNEFNWIFKGFFLLYLSYIWKGCK